MSMYKAVLAAIVGTALLAGCSTQSGSQTAQQTQTPEEKKIFGGIDSFRAGDFGTAERSWSEILQTEPNNPYAHLNLGVIKAITSREQEAVGHYEKAIQYGGGAPVVTTINQEGTVVGRGETTVAALARGNLSRLKL